MTKRRTWLAIVCWLGLVGSAAAESPLNPSTTVADNLRSMLEAKKAVTVVLKGGTAYSGKIAAVGDHQLLLSELTGKEFYDALVAIDEIAVVEVRAR